MFTKVTLKNFRSFDHLEFDLSSKKDTPKNLIMIYGENGAGKSNLMSAFYLLKELMQTMDVRDFYEEILNSGAILSDEKLEQQFKQRLVSGLRDIKTIINDYCMVGCDDSLRVEYEFVIDGKPGKYLVEFGCSEIIHERLEYKLNLRKGVYYDCTSEEITINNSIISNSKFMTDIRMISKKFWGKHSLLAIILHEISDKSEAYINESISENFKEVLGEFSCMSCNVRINQKTINELSSPLEIFENAVSGEISKSKEQELELAEKVFTQFFTAINSDVKKIYYFREENGNYISYKLQIVKMIAGHYRDIAFSRESSGNRQVLHTLCYLMSACLNGTVVIDEADSSIHDMLFLKIINEIEPYINGQLIFTTHNTMLMTADFARTSTYILAEEEFGRKTIRCISEFEKRTYANNNVRRRYIESEYGGLPKVDKIDFGSMVKEVVKYGC